MSRRAKTYLNSHQKNLTVLAALASASYSGPLLPTDNESTANNRRVVYRVRCDLCSVEYQINKKHMHEGRKCPNCKNPHPFMLADKEKETVTAAEEAPTGRPQTLFVAGCGYVYVDGNYASAQVRLQTHRPVFYAAWQVNGAAFAVPQGYGSTHLLVHWTKEERGLAESFSLYERAQQPPQETQPLTLEPVESPPEPPPPTEPEPEPPTHLLALAEQLEKPPETQTPTPVEGWFDDLHKAAAFYGLLPPLPNRNEGWIATDTSKRFAEANRPLPKALEGCVFGLESAAAYPTTAHDNQTWWYVYPQTISAKEGFFG